jgi:hypothetical protein
MIKKISAVQLLGLRRLILGGMKEDYRESFRLDSGSAGET